LSGIQGKPTADVLVSQILPIDTLAQASLRINDVEGSRATGDFYQVVNTREVHRLNASQRERLNDAIKTGNEQVLKQTLLEVQR